MNLSISVVGNRVYICGNEEEVRNILKKLENEAEIQIIYEGLCG